MWNSKTIFVKTIKILFLLILINQVLSLIHISYFSDGIVLKHTESEAKLIGYHLEEMVKKMINSNNIPAVQGLLESVGSDRSIENITLVNREGIITASSDMLTVNKYNVESAKYLDEIIYNNKLKLTQNNISQNHYKLIIPVSGERYHTKTQNDFYGLLEITMNVAAIRNEYDIFKRFILVEQSLFFIAFAVFSFILIFRYILNPLKKIESTVRNIINGDYNTFVDYKTSDEIGSLAAVFNRMIEKISQNTAKLNLEIEERKTAENELIKYKENLEIIVEERTSDLKSTYNKVEMQVIELESANKKLSVTNLKLENAYKQLKDIHVQLVQSEKMAGLGTLVAGVAHEINNPVNYILISSRTLEHEIDSFNKELMNLLEGNENSIMLYIENTFKGFNSGLKNILEGLNKIQNIVKDLRSFSMLGESEKKNFSLVESINSSLKIIKMQFKNINFIFEYKAEIGIECFPSQLNQVFLNILLNSCHAITEKQTRRKSDETGEITVSLTDSGKEVVIQIKDNGCGIKEEIKANIFEPFFTTKPAGSGTGLGLPISLNIIQMHSGRIDIESQENVGTTVSIFLPKQFAIE